MSKVSFIISIAGLCIAAATLVLVATASRQPGAGLSSGQAWTAENQRALATKLKSAGLPRQAAAATLGETSDTAH